MNLDQLAASKFLRVEEDSSNPGIWCISCIGATTPGSQFVIVCNDKKQASDVVLKISNNQLNYPTVDSQGFKEVTSHFPHIKDLTRVFDTTKLY